MTFPVSAGQLPFAVIAPGDWRWQLSPAYLTESQAPAGRVIGGFFLPRGKTARTLSPVRNYPCPPSGKCPLEGIRPFVPG